MKLGYSYELGNSLYKAECTSMKTKVILLAIFFYASKKNEKQEGENHFKLSKQKSSKNKVFNIIEGNVKHIFC